MLTTTNILKINSSYNKAIQTLRNKKPAYISIGRLDKNSSLIYIVKLDSIELGISYNNICQSLTPEKIQLLKSGFSDKPDLIKMIDIADNLNTFSNFKSQIKMKA